MNEPLAVILSVSEESRRCSSNREILRSLRFLRMTATILLASGVSFAAAETPAPFTGAVLGADDLVKIALSSNTQVRAAKAQYEAALHQIDQTYTPQDPQLNYTIGASPSNLNGWVGTPTGSGRGDFPGSSALGLHDPAVRTLGVSESFQFPGKALLQGSQARRNAEIARLMYMAAARDVRAQVLTVYYQTLLDSASVNIALDNTVNFAQVLQVVKTAYTGSQAAQSDLISAELALVQSSQTVRMNQVAEANDEAALNQVLDRDPRTPLSLAPGLDLKPVEEPLDPLVKKSLELRQELLEAALSEKNSKTALKLVWMELLPDFNVSYARNWYYTIEGEPHTGIDHDNTASLGFNVPIFFWFHQKEDIRSAARLLEAARQNRKSVETQTMTSVVQLYRTTLQAYRTALLNRDLLVPLANQNFRVALVAYQSKKVDFLTLSSALQGIYNARIGTLTASNQFLAGRVALEQAIGEPLP